MPQDPITIPGFTTGGPPVQYPQNAIDQANQFDNGWTGPVSRAGIGTLRDRNERLERWRRAKSADPNVPDFLANIGGNLSTDKTVQLAYAQLADIINSKGATDPKMLEANKAKLAAGLAASTPGSLGEVGVGNEIQARGNATEAQLAAKRKRDDLGLVQEMILTPGIRKYGEKVRSAADSYSLSQQRLANRDALFGGIQSILQGAGNLYTTYTSNPNNYNSMAPQPYQPTAYGNSANLPLGNVIG